MEAEKVKLRRILRKKRVRSKVFGLSKKPRLSVFRSNKHIYAQIIDDEEAKTLVSASDLELDVNKDKKLSKTLKAEGVGELIAERALEKGIKRVVFDRNGYKYHGRIKALAEAARRKGLLF